MNSLLIWQSVKRTRQSELRFCHYTGERFLVKSFWWSILVGKYFVGNFWWKILAENFDGMFLVEYFGWEIVS